MQNKTGYPSIDRPWLQYYSGEKIGDSIVEKTIYDSIYGKNKDYLKETALIYFNSEISFGKLFSETDKVATALLSYGVRKGDVVNLCVSAVPEAVYLVLACSRIGALANFINPLFTTEQKIARLNETESGILFVLDKMIPYVEEAINGSIINSVIVIPAVNSIKGLGILSGIKKKYSFKYVLFNHFISNKRYNDVNCIEYERNLPVVMVYSSGTTGASKGIMLTNDGLNATYMMERHTLKFIRGERMLEIIPIWFSTGISLSVLAPLSSGAAVILEPNYSCENFVKAIKKYRPTALVGTPSLWEYAIKSKELSKVDLKKLRHVMSGGEALSVTLENRVNTFLIHHGCHEIIRKGYGQCELGGTVTLSENKTDESGIENVGIPLCDIIASSFDIDTNEEKKIGERGEIRVLSPAKMLGYFKKPKETEEFFYTDAIGRKWACTGDIGYVRPDGKVVICGRASNSFISDSGKRIYLFDIKNCILENGHIVRCEVVDIEINGSNKAVAHLIVDNRSDSLKILNEIGKLCKKLPEEARPIAYKIRDSFALNPTSGKCDTTALRQEKEGFIDASGKSIQIYT